MAVPVHPTTPRRKRDDYTRHHAGDPRPTPDKFPDRDGDGDEYDDDQQIEEQSSFRGRAASKEQSSCARERANLRHRHTSSLARSGAAARYAVAKRTPPVVMVARPHG
jgi:hypothetical protein